MRILVVFSKTTVIQHWKNVTFILFKSVYQLIMPITPTERKPSFIAENKLVSTIAHDVFFISPHWISGGIRLRSYSFSLVQVFHGNDHTRIALAYQSAWNRLNSQNQFLKKEETHFSPCHLIGSIQWPKKIISMAKPVSSNDKIFFMFTLMLTIKDIGKASF